MTFSELVTSYLEKNGMFPNQSNAVLAKVQASEAGQTMKGRWNDDVSGYPDIMQGLVLLSANDCAVEYIDAEIPKAWFRPMFVN